MSIRKVIEASIERFIVHAQVRRTFDEGALNALAESIKTVGVLQPILARPEGERLVIVDGERRYRAALRAGLASVPVAIEEDDVAPGAVLQKQLIANVQREDLQPREKAAGIQQLMKATGWSAADAAAKLGMSSAGVSRLLALLTLPEAIGRRIDTGEIPASAGYELSRVKNADEQAALAERVAKGLTRDALAGATKRDRTSKAETGSARKQRLTVALANGRSVTLAGAGLNSLDALIVWLEELLAKARKFRPKGLELSTFVRILRDEAKTV